MTISHKLMSFVTNQQIILNNIHNCTLKTRKKPQPMQQSPEVTESECASDPNDRQSSLPTSPLQVCHVIP